MTAVAETVTRTPVRDFLAGLLDDAYGYRLPDGNCVSCTRSDTNRCETCQQDQDKALRYLAIFQAVDKASGDEDALYTFLDALPEAERS